MGNLFPRRNVSQCTHFERFVVRRIRLVAVIDASQVTLNVEPIFLPQSQPMVSTGRYVGTIGGSDETVMSFPRTLVAIHTGVCMTDQ